MPQYIDYAEYYDDDIAATPAPFVDIPFYLQHARQCGSPILELACGTGRVLIPLAKAGFEMYGVDFSENMLAVCHRKVMENGVADRVHLSRADMASFDLPRKDFAFVYIPVRSFMHLFTMADRYPVCNGSMSICGLEACSLWISTHPPFNCWLKSLMVRLSCGENLLYRTDTTSSAEIALCVMISLIRFTTANCDSKNTTGWAIVSVNEPSRCTPATRFAMSYGFCWNA